MSYPYLSDKFPELSERESVILSLSNKLRYAYLNQEFFSGRPELQKKYTKEAELLQAQIDILESLEE